MSNHKKGYLVDIENIKKEFLLLTQKYNEYLSYSFLKKNGYNYLLCAIQRTGLSLPKFYKIIGYEIKHTPKNYYKDINNVNKEIYKLVEKYGYFPKSPFIITLEGKNQLILCLSKFHNTTLNKHLKSLNLEYKSNYSDLELYVKSLLDKFILDTNFIDNGRKELLEKGLLLKNPETGRFLELDRYYFDVKVAIEIQGQQHYRHTKLWDETRCNSVKKIDIIKRQLLQEQGIYLIEIHYQRIGKETIYNQLKDSGVLKLCEKEKIFE